MVPSAVRKLRCLEKSPAPRAYQIAAIGTLTWGCEALLGSEYGTVGLIAHRDGGFNNM
jgi:hypothetical protein